MSSSVCFPSAMRNSWNVTRRSEGKIFSCSRSDQKRSIMFMFSFLLSCRIQIMMTKIFHIRVINLENSEGKFFDEKGLWSHKFIFPKKVFLFDDDGCHKFSERRSRRQLCVMASSKFPLALLNFTPFPMKSY